MKFIQYVQESFEELKTEVTWTPWEEARKSMFVVAIFTVIFALAVFAVDKLFQTGLSEFFNL